MMRLIADNEFFIFLLLVCFICRGVFEVVYRKTEFKHLKGIVSVQTRTEQWSQKKLFKMVFWILGVLVTFPIAYIFRDNYFIWGLTIATISFFVDVSFDYKYIES